MLARDEAVGVISVQNFERENVFTEADVRLLTTIAGNVGIAIQNAQLYTAAQQELAERKRAEETLRESEEHYRAVVEQVSEGIVLYDVNTGSVLETNAAYQALLGYTAEEMQRLDASSTRRYGGMGIGLALCRAIAEAHGGKVWAESAGNGQGSTFYVALPAMTTSGNVV